jgi:hypothetical protein
MSGTASPHCLPQYFDEFHTVDIHTGDHLTGLDSPGPSSVNMVGEEEEKVGNMAAFHLTPHKVL